MEFNFSAIERKWKQEWEKQQLYKVTNDTSKPKYYVLDMFPYPSGAGLHVGHPLGYIASDIYSRYKRMKGFNVLHPMGFDEFGLPTEQYAIETGQHPAKTTQDNIKRYKEQLDNIGFCFDWTREVNTSSAKYYQWTQYLFIQIYNSWFCKAANKAKTIDQLIEVFEKAGNINTSAYASNYKETFTAEQWKQFSEKEKSDILMKYRLAYLDYAEVNWCPALGTVLANDEVINGVSERGGHPVEKKKMRQWFLRITAYADRLLDALPTLDWSKSMKDMQTNWIGRSEGALIKFRVDSLKLKEENNSQLEIFTTRPDTIFGATFMVMAPEHPMLESIVNEEQKDAINKYIAYVKSKTEVERQQNKQVTGEFTGAYATHPFTNQPIPIYIAEYVLWGYGTGAIMAVPSDDERDSAFAEKFNLPIIEVIDRSMYPNASMEDKVGKLINSDFLNGLEIKEAISKMIQTLVDKQIGERRINYRLRDAGFSRQRYWGEPIPIKYENEVPHIEHQLPLVLPEVTDFNPSADGRSPLANVKSWTDAGYETDTMPGYAGSSWYFLRYMDPSNENAFVSKEAEQYWQNVDLYIGGTEHAVGHLLYSRLWQNIFFDLGMVSHAEPFKKLVNQGMIQGRSSIVYRVNGTHQFVSKNKKSNYETTELHCDVNIVDNDILDIEKFKAWREEYANAEFILEDDGTYACGYEIEKMSKRWYNVVNPDDMVAKYGADCFRMYEMFLGPLEDSKPWSTQGIDGVAKFLRKVWRLFYDDKGTLLINDEKPTKDEYKIIHKTIKKINEDIERLSLNTSIPALMICTNELGTLKCNKKEILTQLVQLMAPFAPFISEELWALLGHSDSVHISDFPQHDESYLVENSFAYPISINGKVRLNIEFPLDMDNASIESSVLADERVTKYFEGKPIKKIIIVKGKIVNVVV